MMNTINFLPIVILIIVTNICFDHSNARTYDDDNCYRPRARSFRHKPSGRKVYKRLENIVTTNESTTDYDVYDEHNSEHVVNGNGLGLDSLPANCGKFFSHKNRVSGGVPAKRGAYPSYVYLDLYSFTKGVGSFCGGTIISSRHILTAAHCVWDRFENHNYTAHVYPTHKLPEIGNTNDYQNYYTTEKICRSKIYPIDKNKPRHDVAIIKVAKPIKFNKNIQPACLPKSHPHETLQLTAIGMGATNTDDDGNVLNLSDVLQVLPVKAEMCDVDDRHDATICFVSSNADQIGDTCVGDSGGGIFGNENGRQIVYGATSYGDAVCQSGVRGKSVNANIHFLLSEIDSLLKECA